MIRARSPRQQWLAFTTAAPVAFALWTCGPEPPTANIVETAGDTTVVRSMEPPRWRAALKASGPTIGAVDGPDEVLFGQLWALSVGPHAEIVLYDSQLNRVLLFDAAGRFIHRIGRTGQGPGEFETVFGLAIGWFQRVFLLNERERILVFDSLGTFRAAWTVPHRIARDEAALTPLEDGSLIVKVTTSLTPRRYGFYRLDSLGVLVDSVMSIHVPFEEELGPGSQLFPTRSVSWLPGVGVVSGVGSRLAFQVQSPTAEPLRMVRNHDPVRLLTREHDDWRRYHEFLVARSGRPEAFPPPPEFKPAFLRILPSRTSEVWMIRRTTAIGRDPLAVTEMAGLPLAPAWLEPMRADVFSRYGEYLGTVAGPAGFSPQFVSSDTIWGFMSGSRGEPIVVRMVAVELAEGP